jgi:hypothetical protein
VQLLEHATNHGLLRFAIWKDPTASRSQCAAFSAIEAGSHVLTVGLQTFDLATAGGIWGVPSSHIRIASAETGPKGAEQSHSYKGFFS